MLFDFSTFSGNPTDSNSNHVTKFSSPLFHRAVTDPRDGRRVALKKLPNVFQSLVSSKRVFRELKMLCFFKHENLVVQIRVQAWIAYKREHCANTTIVLVQLRVKLILGGEW
ncbi:Serine/threonine kinase NLK [Operophtera brumata]|uniref:Serine/threonine kinase NLK n=1 Tax=Operophtera brumata TaxID=104452 RepID=A0A0L7LS65_OPEBR|nr:Serine/threonine kinase NLK [Operophtera brumata]